MIHTMPDAHAICRACGITLHGKRTPHTGLLAPKTTYSKGTIQQIAKAHGVDHAYMVLEAIVSAPHNETELYGVTIRAVSLWLSEGCYQPEDAPYINQTLRLHDLASMRNQVRELNWQEQPLRMAERLAAFVQNYQEGQAA